MGHAIAGMLSVHGCKVHVLCRNPNQWRKLMSVDYMGTMLVGAICSVTSNVPNYAFDVIVISCPLTAAPDILKTLTGKLQGQPPLVCVPGRLFCQYLDEAGFSSHPAVLVSRVPYICRTQTYGASVRVLGIAHDGLKYATRNCRPNDLLRKLFKMDTRWLPNRLSIDMSNSNSLLHPARMVDIFCSRKAVYRTVKFYADWTDNASTLLMRADDELQCIIRHLNNNETAHIEVTPILSHYECANAPELTNKIASITSLKEIEVPLTDDCKLDKEHRYYTEDVLVGLRAIVQAAEESGVDTPTIHFIYRALTTQC